MEQYFLKLMHLQFYETSYCCWIKSLFSRRLILRKLDTQMKMASYCLKHKSWRRLYVLLDTFSGRVSDVMQDRRAQARIKNTDTIFI